MTELDRAGGDAQGLEVHELRAAIYRLSGAGVELPDELGRVADSASEGIARARQALADSSAALSDYQTNHVVNAGGRIASTANAGGVGQAALAVAAAIAAAGMAKTAQLRATAAQNRNESSSPDTRSLLAKEFEQARAESLQKNGDVRRGLRRLRERFAQALREFFQKHGAKIEGLLKVAGIGVPLATLLVGVGVITGGGAVAVIGLAPFYLAAAKFAVEMAKYEAEHGFKNNRKTYLMATKEAVRLALAAHEAELFTVSDTSAAWTKAALAAADYAWKIIELRNRRGFRPRGETFLTATKEGFAAAFEVAIPFVGEKNISLIVARGTCTAFFNIVEQRPAGGYRWKREQFFETVEKEVIKSAVGEFLKFKTSPDSDETKAPGFHVKNITFNDWNAAWELGSDTVPDAHAYFKDHSEAYLKMTTYVENKWKRP
jgi:hypothetical protein